MITWMKKANNFQVAKVQSQGFALIFCQFQPGVAYKSVASKKKRVASEEVVSLMAGYASGMTRDFVL